MGANLPRLCQKHPVYVVEPHPLAARLLRATLEQGCAFKVRLSEISLTREAIPQNGPCILIIDADALPFPFAAFLRTASMTFPGAQVLVIGNRPPDDELCRLLFHGVSGFVTYDKVEQQMCAAVETLGMGRLWFPTQVLERYAMFSAGLEKEKRGERDALSPRESEVIGLLQRRLSNKEISSALGISERTVRFHLHNIFEKLGVHDRHSVLEWARVASPAGPQSEVSTWKTA